MGSQRKLGVREKGFVYVLVRYGILRYGLAVGVLGSLGDELLSDRGGPHIVSNIVIRALFVTIFGGVLFAVVLMYFPEKT